MSTRKLQVVPLPITYCLLPIANCQLHVANCQLHVANCQLHVANCQLHVANCPLPIAYSYFLSIKFYKQIGRVKYLSPPLELLN